MSATNVDSSHHPGHFTRQLGRKSAGQLPVRQPEQPPRELNKDGNRSLNCTHSISVDDVVLVVVSFLLLVHKHLLNH